MFRQYLKIQSNKLGRGLYTSIQIPANAPILELGGSISLKDAIKENDTEYIQIGSKNFLSPSGGIEDALNHHCQPNCKLHVVGNRAILFSLYVIPAGAELNWDWATTSTDSFETWKMECKCGSYQCRKIISGHSSLPQELWDDYDHKGMLPLYIVQPGMFKK